MAIEAKVVAHSIDVSGVPLITMQLKYPRFIHSEFMTHRVFSRNASSSRAIPVKRQLELITVDPAMPIHWGSNKPGMQAGDELDGREIETVKGEWSNARRKCLSSAKKMMVAGLHKQVANRILEPWQHISVVVTATEWDNFFMLRDHWAAQPEIRALAIAMKDALADSFAVRVERDLPIPYHLPYITRNDLELWAASDLTTDDLVKCSVARCARVSYLNHDGTEPDIEKDIALHDKLHEMKHMSPFEHVGKPMMLKRVSNGFTRAEWEPGLTHIDRDGNTWSGNFRHWIQYRNLL